ncbi:MAG: hypothetical protein K2L12_01640 [Clostridia bacterium]|nr:hypothetical protein [Clostridia bacterium]
MKDKRLEKEFDEYFKGVSTPDNITADAKKYVKQKNSFMPKFLKIASVMASCILVVTLSVIIVMNRPTVTPPSADNNPPATGLPSDPSAPSDNDPPAEILPPDYSSSTLYYYDENLTTADADAYALPGNAHYKLIKKLANSKNASVYDCKNYYFDDELVLFSARVEMLYSLTRYDAQVYIEFAPDKVYAPLKDYTDPEKKNYKGVEYYVSETVSANGEPQFKLCAVYKGAKYYFDIISSDRQAYIKYLEFVVKNY